MANNWSICNICHKLKPGVFQQYFVYKVNTWENFYGRCFTISLKKYKNFNLNNCIDTFNKILTFFVSLYLQKLAQKSKKKKMMLKALRGRGVHLDLKVKLKLIKKRQKLKKFEI